MSAFESFPRITPFLWFNSNAEEAVEFYISVFQNSRRLDEVRKGRDVITIAFELDGLKFTALNGGPTFTFNEAVSLTVRCDTQEEIDYYWEKLSSGGKEIQCGWLKDKYGLCWQIVPTCLPGLIKTANGMKAMMTMVKFDIAALERAAAS
jgi:predicted 3-demethylubiquinone-9 3-methyltransferase (glyoxalase superfamily)